MLYCEYPAYLLHGGGMSDTEYAVWGPRASRKIDRLTFGRAAHALADHPLELTEPLEDACAQLADLLRGQAEAAARLCAGLTGASTDGYSESYSADADAAAAAAESRCRHVLADALGSDRFGLLYAGVV